MRHRKKGRILGRSPSHRRAMLRNLASALILTERDAEFDDNKPTVAGRVVTTLQKAKEVRPLVEKCVTIARNSLKAEQEAHQYEADAERGSDAWRKWRKSDQWQQWVAARAPVIAARRRVLQLIHDKRAVQVLFDRLAARFEDRNGGYTRIMKLAEPRLGDAGTRAILEFVGVHDRVVQKSVKPSFEDDEEQADGAESADAESDLQEEDVADPEASLEEEI